MKTQTVLITGASSGIGKALAEVVAADHYHVILVSRRVEELEALAHSLKQKYAIEAFVIAADLSLAGECERVYQAVKSQGLTVDILVNNAGVGGSGPFETLSVEQIDYLIRLNIGALTTLTRLFLPDMIAAQRGKILQVSSIAAFQPGPGMAVYYATKAYVLSLSEALWQELKSHHIMVSALCPGPTATNFFRNTKKIRLATGTIGFMSAETVAKAGWRGLLKGQRVIIPGWGNRLLRFIGRVSPKRMVLWITSQLNQLK